MMRFLANRKFKKAFEADSIEGMKNALAKGADINILIEENGCKETFLFLAVEKNKYDIAKFLLERGANVNAVMCMDPDRYMLETEKMFDLFVDFYSPITFITQSYHYDQKMLELLLKYKPDFNQKDYFKKTAMDYVVQSNNLEAVQMLLKAGADFKKYTDLVVTAEDSPERIEVINFLKDAERKDKIEKVHVSTGWKLISAQEISLTEKKAALGYSLTEIFNFAPNERSYTTIYKDLETGKDSHSIKSFNEFANQTKLLKAYHKLIEAGGTADRRVICDQRMDKKD